MKPATLEVDDTGGVRACLCRFGANSSRGEVRRHTVRMLDLFPESARIENGALTLGGIPAESLAAEFGTPLVAYCEQTLRAQAAAYSAVGGVSLVVYGVKAFPNVAIMRLLGAAGLGADVSTAGELEYALRAGIPSDRIVFHGNNKSDEELASAAQARALVVLDALEEAARAARAGVERVLFRVTPPVEAETHRAIRTAHSESKFGLDLNEAFTAIAGAREVLDPVGVHMHIGSQLVRTDESVEAVDLLLQLCLRCRDELGWTPEIVDLGGGLGVRHSRDETLPSIPEFAKALVERFRSGWPLPARIILEPGRSLLGRAGMTLYRIGATKRRAALEFAAIDGGMADNPRPQLYGARYEALLANRADEPADTAVRIAGKHCESGDVLIDNVALPKPRRDDLLAVPATGAYTLAMASNYNGVPRPAAVLVAEGRARLIRRRETIDDLLAFEP